MIADIERSAVSRAFPDGTPYRAIGVREVAAIAAASGIPLRQVELAALERDILPERYARNFRSFSFADQAALLRARIAVVGLGGLGGAVSEILARLGVGRLTLIDGDRFEESNLNRQLFSTTEALGTPKAEAAAARIRLVNPAIETDPRITFLTAENGPGLLAGCRAAVDCLDNLPSRFVLEDACRSCGIPLVSAAVAGSSGHVMSVFPGDRGLRAIYGEPGRAPRKGAEAAFGTLPFAVWFLACLECAEVVKLLLRRGTPLRGRLFLADLIEGLFELVRLGAASEDEGAPQESPTASDA
ncbi:MAG: HesA/MoeB/ThiF family protein [Desulfobacterales bacterium]